MLSGIHGIICQTASKNFVALFAFIHFISRNVLKMSVNGRHILGHLTFRNEIGECINAWPNRLRGEV